MKYKVWTLTAFVLAGLTWAHFGCIKGNPIGADVSTLANTTLTVLVTDNKAAQAGVTIQVTDPFGNITTQTTATNGQTAFSTKVAGQYTVTIPTQGNFYQSTAAVNVVAGTVGPSITFTAQGQQLILSPITPETYGISGANITYLVTYSESGNLAEPVSLAVTGAITQTGWAANFNFPVLGSTTNTSQLNIIIPQGSYQQPTFTVEAFRLNGTLLTSSATRVINKNYSVQTNFIVNTITTGSVSIYCSSGITVTVPTTIIGNVSLSTVNAGDTTTPWVLSLNVSGINLSSGITTLSLLGCSSSNPVFNGQFLTNDGMFNSGSTDSFQMVTGALKPVTIIAPYCVFIFNASGIGSPITVQMPPQSINLNMSLTSAIGSSQGAVTNVNFCSAAGGSVFTLTH